jgi:cell division protein FtsB
MVTHISPDASHVTIMKRSGSGRCRQAILASCMALALFSVPSHVWAGDSNKHRLINQQRVQDMKEKIADLKVQLKEYKQSPPNRHWVRGSLQDLDARVDALEATVAKFDPSTLLALLESLQRQIEGINVQAMTTRMTDLETVLNARMADLNTKVDNSVVPNLKNYVEVKTSDMNGVKGPHLVFRGVNVHVQSGAGATADAASGLGNLIIGYNEQASPEQVRLGAHNLVGGSQNGFSSYGGLVFGVANKVTGTYASVVGGESNTASGVSSSVLGGKTRSATWQNATSSAGTTNPTAGF